MTRIIRAAIAATAVIAVAAPAAQASVTTSVTMKNYVHLSKDQTKFNGDGSIKQIGKFIATGRFKLPNSDYTWTFGDGSTLKIHIAGNLDATGHPIGVWTVTGGTKQFKGAKGKGKMRNVEVLGKDPVHQIFTGKLTTKKQLVKAPTPEGWTATPDTTS